MKYPKLREIKEAVKALITKPYTSQFPHVPHIPCLSFRGRPYFHDEECVGCTACVNVCPTGALAFKDIQSSSGYKRLLTVRWDICIECGQCELNCLTETGIQLSNEFDMTTTEERKDLQQIIEKELLLCEQCQRPTIPKQQMEWTIKKLGYLYVSNTSLIAFSQKSIGVREEYPQREEEVSRWDRFRILCPQCRRQAVITS